MLKSKTKRVRENVRGYILKYFDPENYKGYPGEFAGNVGNFDDVKNYIMKTFHDECGNGRKNWYSELERFENWASSLPSILDCRYYYNRSAVGDLGDILEESPEERARLGESEAKFRLTYLIFRELTR